MGNRSWQRRERQSVPKNRAQKGAILVISLRIARTPEALGGENVSEGRQPAREAYNCAVLEFKKEIPA